ncbi:MAG: YqcC family protein [Pseudomonas sp.]
MQRWHVLAEALLMLEQELRQQGLWAAQPPSPAVLASPQPFCVDTLAFEGWLQWIFIPRMAQIIENGGVMPAGCNIQPMGEQAFAHLCDRGVELVRVLGRIDRAAEQLAIRF